MAPVDIRNKLEQIRKNKQNKNKKSGTNSNVKDLRQLIVKKTKTKGGSDRSPNRTARGRITKQNNSRLSTSGSRDLRDTNNRLASRKNVPQTSRDRTSSNRSDRLTSRSVQPVRTSTVVKKRTVANGQAVRIGKKLVHEQQYYVPPHMQQRNQTPTYIIASAPTHKSRLPIDAAPEPVQGGASVLISNLTSSITQSDIIELFGDIGVMTAVNIINSTTALVSYQNSSDAVRAVKVYHNRLLDGRPMLVNMMPNSVWL